jgi:hypothetical protein
MNFSRDEVGSEAYQDEAELDEGSEEKDVARELAIRNLAMRSHLSATARQQRQQRERDEKSLPAFLLRLALLA